MRLIQRGVVGPFYELLDCPPPPEVRSNAAMPQPFLELMYRNRHLRPDAESPEAEFIVGTRIGRKEDPSAWALPSEMHTKILADLVEDTRALLKHLEPEDRAVVSNDPRWWDATYYADRQPVSPDGLNTPEVLTDLYQRLCTLARRNPDSDAITSISQAAIADDLVAADAYLLELIDVIYAQSWRWKATRARRRMRAILRRAPLR